MDSPGVEDDMIDRDSLKEVLLRELRSAAAARIASGVDADAMTVNLIERLRRLRKVHEEVPGRRP